MSCSVKLKSNCDRKAVPNGADKPGQLRIFAAATVKFVTGPNAWPTCLAPRKNPSRRPPLVLAFRRQHHRLRHGLLAAEIISDGSAGEAEGFGGAVEGEGVALHPGADCPSYALPASQV